ncbi:MAG: YckD family protein [Clostridia bacterium]|nr:YckD family protein [Clostridia bacterium]
MKVKILITTAIVVASVIPFTVFAATSDAPAAKTVRGFFHMDTSKLTEQQKSELKEYFKKMVILQKETVNKMVSNGSLTKEQGDAFIKKIDAISTAFDEKGFAKGLGMGKGHFGFLGINGIDVTKLTAQQKADLQSSLTKMADLQKEIVNKTVSYGLLTKEQGDASIKRIDEMTKNIIENGFPKGMEKGRGKGGFHSFEGKKEIDTSKLTDQQKAGLKESSAKMVALQKDIVNKMVSNGALTKEQGEASIKKIDEISKNSDGIGFGKGLGMGKGGFGCFAIGGIDFSKLTDQQKADLKSFSTKAADLEKEVVNKLVSYGLLTKEQGDASIKRIDEMSKNFGENSFPNKGMGKKRGGFGGHKRGGFDWDNSTKPTPAASPTPAV